MADSTQTKELIYSVKLDIEATNKGLDAFNERVKAGQEATAKMVVSSNELQEAMKRDETIRKKTKETIDAEAGSIRALREQNKELTAARNNTSLATEEGRKKVKELNEQLDKNNEKIKDNVDSYTKQKIGIGAYSSALDKLVPGLGATTNGLKETGKEMWKLVSNPFGATLAAISLLLGTIIKYFQGSEEAQNRWNKVVAVGSALLEKFWDLVEGVGESLVNIATNPKKAFQELVDFIVNNVINRFKAVAVIAEGIANLDFKKVANGFLQLGTGVEDVIGKVQTLGEEIAATFNEAITQGNRLAQLQAQIDRDEREAIVERARVALEVAKLRERSIREEGAQRKETIQEAIALEQALSDAEVRRSQLKLEQAQLELKTNGDDKDAKMKVAQAEAEVINAMAQRFEATLRFQKELERLRDEEQKAIDERDQAVIDKNQAILDRNLSAFEKHLQDKLKAEGKALATQEKANKEAADKRKAIEQQGADFATQSLNKITGSKLDSGKLVNNFFKAGAFKQTQVNAELMSTGAYSALVGIPIVGPIIAPIAAAVAKAYGYASAAGIQAITFARGGELRGRRHEQGGIPFTINGKPGFEAEDGEILINRNSSRMFRRELSAINQAGGGVKFAGGGILTDTRAISSATETRLAMSSLATTEMARAMLEVLSQPQPPVLVLQDFEAKQAERDQTVNRAKVL